MSDNFLQMLAHYLQRIFANFSGAFSGSCIRWHNFAPPPLPRIQGGPALWPPLKAAGGGAPGHHLPITCAAHSKNISITAPLALHFVGAAKTSPAVLPSCQPGGSCIRGRLPPCQLCHYGHERRERPARIRQHPHILQNSSRQFCRKLARPQYDKIPGRLAPAVFRHIVNLEKTFPRRKGPRLADPCPLMLQ